MKLIYVFKDFLVSRACFVTLEITRMQFRVNRALRSVVLQLRVFGNLVFLWFTKQRGQIMLCASRVKQAVLFGEEALLPLCHPSHRGW